MTEQKQEQTVFAEAAFEKLVDANIAEIAKVYGTYRADNANIGWVSDEVSIASKVYGLGAGRTMIVTTRECWVNGKTTYEHTHEAY